MVWQMLRMPSCPMVNNGYVQMQVKTTSSNTAICPTEQNIESHAGAM